jgi:hypothetical protein
MSQSYDHSANSSQDDRQDRSIRPLGSAYRPGRSRTPTPSNPHPHLPGPSNSSTSSSSSSNISNSNTSAIPSPTATTANNNTGKSRSSDYRSLRSSIGNTTTTPSTSFRDLKSRRQAAYSPSSSSTRSRSTQAQAERRPWFPYPAPNVQQQSPSTSSSSSYPRGTTLLSTQMIRVQMLPLASLKRDPTNGLTGGPLAQSQSNGVKQHRGGGHCEIPRRYWGNWVIVP